MSNSDPFVWKPDSPLQLSVVARTPEDKPLKGLRLAVKDLFHIANIATTAGNPDWLKSHVIPKHTNSIVTRLIETGATLVGKTITDELAYSLNGQNIHYGTPVNATDPQRLPGGSSSGSAAAVALDQADIGLGTDTGGSIRVPASYNGLFGLRPTHGVLSTDNMVALAPGFDTVGWMCRDLNTLTRVADVLFEATEVTATAPPDIISYSPAILEIAEHHSLIKSVIVKQQASITQLEPELLSKASTTFRILQGRQIWRQHGNWIKKQHPTFAKDIQQRLDWCASLTEKDEQTAQITAETVKSATAQLFNEHSLFLLPTTPGPAPRLNSEPEYLNLYRNQLMGLTSLAGLSGLPQLHIPLKTKGPGIGYSLLGPLNSDRQLIATAKKLTGESL